MEACAAAGFTARRAHCRALHQPFAAVREQSGETSAFPPAAQSVAKEAGKQRWSDGYRISRLDPILPDAYGTKPLPPIQAT